MAVIGRLLLLTIVLKEAKSTRLKDDIGSNVSPEVLMTQALRTNFIRQLMNPNPFDLFPEILIGKMVWQSIENYVRGCHLVLVTSNPRHLVIDNVIKYSAMAFEPLVLVDVNTLSEGDSAYLHTALWGDLMTPCRAVLIDFMQEPNTYDVLIRFLDKYKLSMWPTAWVVAIGPNSKAKTILFESVFRNTLQPVYIGVHTSILQKLRIQSTLLNKAKDQTEKKLPVPFDSAGKTGTGGSLRIYSRCLYCNNGDPTVKFLFFWPMGTDLSAPLNPFPDQFKDTLGHKFRVVSMSSFPHNDYMVDSDEVSTTITLRDCLDKRLLKAISSHLNFTYETRAPWDMQWGVPTPSGNFTGLVGTIQYNKADFITTIAPTPSRNTIIDTTRAYTSDVLSVVSLKPQLLPQYLVIIRPFTAEVWLCLFLSIMIWGVSLWVLQWCWLKFSENKTFSFSWAIFYSWAVILDHPPEDTPKNLSGQILLLIWLLSCLVITNVFRSSLVAYLAVQSKTKPIDNFQDLVTRGEYEWGMEARFLTGVSLIYFTTTTDPVVQRVYKSLEYLENHQEAFGKTIKGKYAIVCWEMLSYMLIDSYYTDEKGNTPYYVSREGYRIVPYFGWGYGKGAPFRDRFSMIMTRLNEAGIIDYWTKDVMAKRVKENREEIKLQTGTGQGAQFLQVLEDTTIQLKMIHMAGVFIVYFLGFVIAFATLIIENITSRF